MPPMSPRNIKTPTPNAKSVESDFHHIRNCIIVLLRVQNCTPCVCRKALRDQDNSDAVCPTNRRTTRRRWQIPDYRDRKLPIASPASPILAPYLLSHRSRTAILLWTLG